MDSMILEIFSDFNNSIILNDPLLEQSEIQEKITWALNFSIKKAIQYETIFFYCKIKRHSYSYYSTPD